MTETFEHCLVDGSFQLYECFSMCSMVIDTWRFGPSENNKWFKYWYAENLTLSFTFSSKEHSYPLTNGYIAAPRDKSYACQSPDIWPMQPRDDIKGRSASLLFQNLQVGLALSTNRGFLVFSLVFSKLFSRMRQLESHFASCLFKKRIASLI